MKMRIKNSVSHFELTFMVLLAVFIFGSGCVTQKPTPDPLAGWKVDLDHNPDQTIVEDYQDYIQKLPPEEKKYAFVEHFFEDGTGQHAVNIEVFANNKNVLWYYALIYDKENKRIKVIKYDYAKYQS